MYSFIPVQANQQDFTFASQAGSAYLMEYHTGKVLFKKRELEKYYPASMTKMMGLLLLFEDLKDGSLRWDEQVRCSGVAASMGGSQIYLKENEEMSVHDLIKSVCIASANDAIVALAEHVSGTQEAFVRRMNEKANALRLENTHFMNATGLHDANHYSCAKDMARIGQELLRTGGKKLLSITSLYDSYIRQDQPQSFWLVNTNKLLKQYPGADGLKTGFTSEAGSCICATAQKGLVRMIAVVMHEPNSSIRNQECKELFNYGFSCYQQRIVYPKGKVLKNITIENGKPKQVGLKIKDDVVIIFQKGSQTKIKHIDYFMKTKQAPIQKGQYMGDARVIMSDGYKTHIPFYATDEIQTMSFFDYVKIAFLDFLG